MSNAAAIRSEIAVIEEAKARLAGRIGAAGAAFAARADLNLLQTIALLDRAQHLLEGALAAGVDPVILHRAHPAAPFAPAAGAAR